MKRIIRRIVENMLSGTKAGFKAILNFEHAIERKKMFNQKSSSTFSAILLSLILMVTAFWVNPAAAQKYVTDPTTGEVVTEPQYGGTITDVAESGVPHGDPYFGGWAGSFIGGVNEMLGHGNWGIDREEYAWSDTGPPLWALKGALAESWDISPDGLTYTFHIRKGVHWHNKAPMNGRELTAQDVEYNFHRYLGLGDFTDAGPSQVGNLAALVSTPFESITATDKWTVVMKLKSISLGSPIAILRNGMAFILPPEVIEKYGDYKDWRNVVGTGPFMLTDFVEDSSVTYEKNPDYWGYDEKYPQNRLPYVDGVKRLIMPDEATRVAALRSGKIDFWGWFYSLDQVESLKQTNPEIVAHTQYVRSSASFAPNVRMPPFSDIRVRQAMQMALDLEGIAAPIWKGYADTTPQGLIGVAGYSIPFEEWPAEVKNGYRYDPEGAKKLLAEAGYPNGFKTVLNYGAWASLDFSEIAVAYWAEIGVDVELDVLTSAEYHERLFSRTGEGMYSAIAGTPYTPAMVVAWYHSDAQWNRPGSQWPELDAMVDAALAATTIEEQQRLIKKADMYAMEKHWLIWGPKNPSWTLVQPWVIGYNGEKELSPAATNDIHARLWIDSELKKEMGH